MEVGNSPYVVYIKCVDEYTLHIYSSSTLQHPGSTRYIVLQQQTSGETVLFSR